MRTVELLLPAGALLGALVALFLAARRRRATGLPRDAERLRVAVRGAAPEPTIEITVGTGAPAGIGAIARTLLASHGARVEEDAGAGRGWCLRLGLPPVPA